VLCKKLNCAQHLQPIDTFSRLLVGPKCICSRGSALNHAGGAYSVPPDLLYSWWGGGRAHCCPPQEPFPHSQPSVLNFGPQEFPEMTWVPQAIKIAAKVEKHCYTLTSLFLYFDTAEHSSTVFDTEARYHYAPGTV